MKGIVRGAIIAFCLDVAMLLIAYSVATEGVNVWSCIVGGACCGVAGMLAGGK